MNKFTRTIVDQTESKKRELKSNACNDDVHTQSFHNSDNDHHCNIDDNTFSYSTLNDDDVCGSENACGYVDVSDDIFYHESDASYCNVFYTDDVSFHIHDISCNVVWIHGNVFHDNYEYVRTWKFSSVDVCVSCDTDVRDNTNDYQSEL